MGAGAHPTPAQQLEQLLARAQNPFDIPDTTLVRLSGAVLVHTELCGRRHRTVPLPALRCSSHRHTFLLSDGGTVTLWELRYDTPSAGGEVRRFYEIYATHRQLRRSEQRAHLRMADGRPPETDQGAGGAAHAPAREHGGHPTESADGTSPLSVPPDFVLAAEHPREREYTGRDAPDHLRRLMRRAENPDHPGEEVLDTLSTALGYDILHVPKPHGVSREFHVWCSVYAHVFALPDGSRGSLYELEHNLSPTGRLICEVYQEESAADRAADRRARELGIGP